METTKISVKERFAYGCGDLGCNIIYSAMSSFLLFYYTDYVKVSALTIGTIMLISRLFDGVTDLMHGGNCRPYKIKIWEMPSMDFKNGNSICHRSRASFFGSVRTWKQCKNGIYILLLITWFHLLYIQRSTYRIQH